MPVLVHDDPKRLARLKRGQQSVEYFQRNLDELRKLNVPYVVLLEDRVVGTGKSPDEARTAATKTGESLEGAVVIHVPREGETYIF